MVATTVTISGTAAQINAALTGLTYTNTPDYNGSAQITVATNDGTVTTTDTIGITVTPVADITNDTVTTNEDTNVSFNVITGTGGATADSFEGTPTVTAINGVAFTAGSPIAITGGTITVATNGLVTFAPAADFNGPTGFSYTVTSGGVTETATVNIGVTPVNDAPVNTVPGSQTTAEDTALPISGVSVAGCGWRPADDHADDHQRHGQRDGWWGSNDWWQWVFQHRDDFRHSGADQRGVDGSDLHEYAGLQRLGADPRWRRTTGP